MIQNNVFCENVVILKRISHQLCKTTFLRNIKQNKTEKEIKNENFFLSLKTILNNEKKKYVEQLLFMIIST